MSRLGAVGGAAIAVPLPAPWRWKRAPKPAVKREPAPKPAVRREPAAKPDGVRERTDRGLARRVAAVAATLPDHPWLDRVVRGRVWIPLLGLLLAGIVAAQVEILKLGANLGRSLEQTSALSTQNEQLRGDVAQLADDQRVQRLATTMGLVLPPPGAVGYLTAKDGSDVSRALGNIHAPDASVFVAAAPDNGALVTGPDASTLPAPLGTPVPPAASTSTSTGTMGATTATSQANATTAATAPTTSATTTAAIAATTPTTATAPPTTATTTSTPATATPATSATPTEPSSVPATGAAAIQPTGTSQPTGGG